MPLADVYYVDVAGGYRYHGATELTMLAKFGFWQDTCPKFLVGMDKLPMPTALTGRRVELEDALALEVAETVLSPTWPRSRGGPYCVKNLTAAMNGEIKLLQEALASKRYQQDKVQAVRDVAATLPKDSPLVKHLRNRCYQCDGPFQSCGCSRRRLTTRDRPGQDEFVPLKRQSGRNHPGCQRRKWLIDNDKMELGDEDFKRHKWGPEHQKVRSELNKKYPGRKSKKGG